MGPSCGVSIAKRAAQTLEAFPDDNVRVLFMLKNGSSLEPATTNDAKDFDAEFGWGARGITLVDAEVQGRETYFGKDQVGTMLLSKGFVIRAVNAHNFMQELPAVLKR